MTNIGIYRNTRPDLPDVGAIARMLGGEVIGRHRVQAPGPGHSSKDRSMSIKLEPNAPDGFLVHSFAGDDPITCKDYIRQRLGLPSFNTPASRPRRDRSTPSFPRPRGLHNRGSTDAHSAEQAFKARWLWKSSVPIAGTPAERYLRDARGYSGPMPATLRYLSPRKSEHRPAMIAAFAIASEPSPEQLEIQSERIAGVHLTLLREDGNAKAGSGRDKLMIGKSLGHPITLAPPNDLCGLVICEGIEDGLSLHQATGLGAWAAGSASRMPQLAETVPDYIESVTIIADPDDTGRKNATALGARLKARGFDVTVKKL